MKATNILWCDSTMELPEEIQIPKEIIPHVCGKHEIKPEYNLLMGYETGKPEKWWYGIKDISFVFMGAWSDSYICYKNYAINSHLIEDAMWNHYNEEYPAPDHKTKEYKSYEEKFTSYMQDNRETVIGMFEDIIACTIETISDYITDLTGFCHNGFVVES